MYVLVLLHKITKSFCPLMMMQIDDAPSELPGRPRQLSPLVAEHPPAWPAQPPHPFFVFTNHEVR
jgi:AP2-like factor, euAP2 lineage